MKSKKNKNNTIFLHIVFCLQLCSCTLSLGEMINANRLYTNRRSPLQITAAVASSKIEKTKYRNNNNKTHNTQRKKIKY